MKSTINDKKYINDVNFIYKKISKVENQHIRMVSEGSCCTED